jgi:ribose transport system permease protein
MLPNDEPRPFRPELLPLLGLALLAGAIWWSDLAMPTSAALVDMLVEVAPLGILVVATTLLLVGGAVDLALGGLAILAAMVAARVPTVAGVAPAVGAVCGLAAATALGVLDGAMVTLARRPAWLVTGAMLVGYAGLSGLLLGLPQIAEAAPARWAALDWRSPGFGLDLMGWLLVVPSLPLALWLWVVVLVLVPCLLHSTVGGNRMLALGASPAVAKGLGIGILRTRMGLFAAAGALAGLAGMLDPATNGPVQPLAELAGVGEALAAAAIGGALGQRRRHAFLGGALALLLLALVGRQLASAAMPPAIALLALAAILLLALAGGARRRGVVTEVA